MNVVDMHSTKPRPESFNAQFLIKHDQKSLICFLWQKYKMIQFFWWEISIVYENTPQVLQIRHAHTVFSRLWRWLIFLSFSTTCSCARLSSFCKLSLDLSKVNFSCSSCSMTSWSSPRSALETSKVKVKRQGQIPQWDRIKIQLKKSFPISIERITKDYSIESRPSLV